MTFPGSARLAEAGLRAELSAADGRCHLVDDGRLEAMLTALAAGRATTSRIRALCRAPVLISSLTAEPGPVCLRCLDAAAPHLAVAARQRADRERAARPPALVTRVAQRLGAPRPRGAGRHRDDAAGHAGPVPLRRGGVRRTRGTRAGGRHQA